MFTGQELDYETGLYNYNARLYDPDLGRFLTPDSIVPDPSNPQSLNRYSYVLNNPMLYTDPSGHGFWRDLGRFFTRILNSLCSDGCGAGTDSNGNIYAYGGSSNNSGSHTFIPSSGANSGGGGGGSGIGSATFYYGGGDTAYGVLPYYANSNFNTPPSAFSGGRIGGGAGGDRLTTPSYSQLSLGYGADRLTSRAGGIAIDFGGGYGSTKVPDGIHSAGNAGSGFYMGFNGRKMEYGLFSYQSTGVIDGVKLGLGMNLTVYNTNAKNFFDGSSNYRTTSAVGSYSKYYSSNGDVIGRSLNIAGKGLGFGNEYGESKGNYYPFK